ncbi:MAG: ATP-binding protein [Clostridiales bacterium]|nr:ATP-binding protein [Clostridiales bacterium]
MKRIIVIAGHYGSGKTELAVSLAMSLIGETSRPWKKLSLVDLDVANPYFRSREKRDMLEKAGITVHADTFGGMQAAELPALTASLRAPLENPDCQTIIDLGGNDAGARVLRQFSKYFDGDSHELWAVVNFRRYETRDVEAAQAHVEAIEKELSMKVTGLVNNTHLLRETVPEIIREGHEKALALANRMAKPLLFTCYPAGIIKKEDVAGLLPLMPLQLYMRPSYLDK